MFQDHNVSQRTKALTVFIVVDINNMYPSTNETLFSDYTLCSAISWTIEQIEKYSVSDHNVSEVPIRVQPWKPSPEPAPWLRTPEPPKQIRQNIQRNPEKRDKKPCIPERTQNSHPHRKKPCSPTKTSESKRHSPNHLPPHHALCTKPTISPEALTTKNLPLLTPGPKSPHQSLLKIGRTSTIWVARRPKTGLATASPWSTPPRTPMSTQAGENQPETSEQSPPPTTG